MRPRRKHSPGTAPAAPAEPEAAPAEPPAAEAGESDSEREARLMAVLDSTDASAAAFTGEANAVPADSEADAAEAKKWLDEALKEDKEGEKKGGFKMPWGKKD